MPTTRPLKVFLCHASADKPAVRKLYQYLRERKMDPWLDAEKLLPGQNWQMEIPKALLASDVIIVCLSKNSVDKEGYVQKEIKFALDKALEMPDGRIFLIPARLEECDLPHSLSTYHYVDLFETDGYRLLLRSLRVRAEQIGAAKVSVGKDTAPPNADISASKEAQPETSALSMLQKQAPEPQNETAIDVGGDVSGANIIVGDNNVIQIMPKPKPDGKIIPAPVYQNEFSIYSLLRKTKSKSSSTLEIFSIGLVALAIISIFAWGVYQLGPRMFSPTSSPMPTEPPIPKPTPKIGPTIDGMTLLYVPAGEFNMGSTNNVDTLTQTNEQLHTIYLDTFWIDQNEITNKQYAACVYVNQCNPPSSPSSSTRTNYYGNSEFDDYPVIHVSWNDATDYCAWVGRRLPTEAEWEKAARGPNGLIYPWGNTAPNKDLLNYNSSIGDTTKVGSYETGRSFYGAYDMAGNVWEWVNDWYSDTYYESSPSVNPLGPDSGDYRVLRGGSWYYGYNNVRSASRSWGFQTDSSTNYVGFRCATTHP